MSRVARSTLPDGYFHVFARGVDRATPLFQDDDDRKLFVTLLARAACRHGWTTHAHCVLGTHYHLVLEARQTDLSRGLCWLNGTYALAFNHRHGRFGHVFADRFTARVIDSEEYLHDACAYVLLNPVRAGLCERIEQWPWSYSRIGLAAS